MSQNEMHFYVKERADKKKRNGKRPKSAFEGRANRFIPTFA
jgi:hypothetical protein